MTDLNLKQKPSGRSGWIVWYSLGGLHAPYNELLKLANDVGLPDEFVPQVTNVDRHKQGSWERGMWVVPTAGLVVPATIKQKEWSMTHYGVEPTIKVKLVKTSGRRALLKRQLLVEVTIANTDDNDRRENRSQANARKQLTYSRAYVLQYNTDTHRYRHIKLPQETEAARVFVNGNVANVVDSIEREIAVQMKNADHDEIRKGFLRFFYRANAFNARTTSSGGGGSGGVYFIPENSRLRLASDGSGHVTTEQALECLAAYIDGIEQFAPKGAKPKLNIIPVYREGDQFSARRNQELISEALVDARKRAEAIVKRIANVREGKTKGQPAVDAALGARADLMQLQAAIKSYQNALGMDASLTETVVQMADKAVTNAQELASESVAKSNKSKS